MKILDRYIAATILTNFLVCLVALLAIFSVINLTQELEDIETGHYGVRQALWFVLLTLPNEAYELFPAATLLAGVNALGLLASRNELVSMWAGGVSVARLIWSVAKAGAPIVVAVIVLGEFAAAPLAQRAATLRSVALSEGEALSTANGFWARDGLRFINIRTPLPGKQVRDLYIYDFDDEHRMNAFTYARTASFTSQRWTLQDLTENRVTNDGMTTKRVASQTWDRFISARQLRLLLFPPQYLSLSDLYRSIRSQRGRGESPRRYELAFWKRMMMPVVTAIMVFLSLSFILRTSRSMRFGKRIAAGALAGIGFQMFSETFGQFGLVYGLSPVLSGITPAVIATGLGLWLMRRTD